MSQIVGVDLVEIFFPGPRGQIQMSTSGALDKGEFVAAGLELYVISLKAGYARCAVRAAQCTVDSDQIE
jgi:hypothetical protein